MATHRSTHDDKPIITYRLMLLGDSFDSASEALGARKRYIEEQAVAWLILTEQRDREAARVIDHDVTQIISGSDWIDRREFMENMMDDMRSEDGPDPALFAPRVQKQFKRCQDSEQHWMSSTEILAAEAGNELDVYRMHIGNVVVGECHNCSAEEDQGKADESWTCGETKG